MWIALVLVISSGAVLLWFAPSHQYLDSRRPWDPRHGYPNATRAYKKKRRR